MLMPCDQSDWHLWPKSVGQRREGSASPPPVLTLPPQCPTPVTDPEVQENVATLACTSFQHLTPPPDPP
jgi:hypothetical protein